LKTLRPAEGNAVRIRRIPSMVPRQALALIPIRWRSRNPSCVIAPGDVGCEAASIVPIGDGNSCKHRARQIVWWAWPTLLSARPGTTTEGLTGGQSRPPPCVRIVRLGRRLSLARNALSPSSEDERESAPSVRQQNSKTIDVFRRLVAVRLQSTASESRPFH